MIPYTSDGCGQGSHAAGGGYGDGEIGYNGGDGSSTGEGSFDDWGKGDGTMHGVIHSPGETL